MNEVYAAVSTLEASNGKHCFVEAIRCCWLAEARMLNQYIPVCVISVEVVVRNCNFHPPIIPVVVFNMPMNSNWAHVISALYYVMIIVII